jgi:nucleoid-associated protein YgaU
MGLFSFIKDAGAKLFGNKEKEAQMMEEEKQATLLAHINSFSLRTEGVTASLSGSTVVLEGEIDTLQEKNRIIMAAGNIDGIDSVDDRVVLTEPVIEIPETQFYTVIKGDWLSKISKKVYGSSKHYNMIYEANKPMLTDPDEIYPGQVLVIPQLVV